MPRLSFIVTQGTILEWLKKPGDWVNKGAALLVIESEKATVEVESPGTGILGPELAPVGTTVPVTTTIGYILEEGEGHAPPEVQKGFETVVAAIEMAREALKPGVRGVDVDAVARGHIVSQGYEEYPHGLGHQVGRFAHDGTALLGPAWEKYASKPFEIIEEGMVFTLEPRLKVPDRGVATIEEMVIVTGTGAEFLSDPQTRLLLI